MVHRVLERCLHPVRKRLDHGAAGVSCALQGSGALHPMRSMQVPQCDVVWEVVLVLILYPLWGL